MPSRSSVISAAILVTMLAAWPASRVVGRSQSSWKPAAAAGYLDQRMHWWTEWPTAARDHDTFCVSCHTVLPYALARPALRQALGEQQPSANELQLADNVTRRVRLWKDVEPFYPDQTRGLPKTSESRGTEAILNALVLASRDAATATPSLTEDTRRAFDNLWALQMKSGTLSGAWAWLNFHNEPWEADNSPYFGASLAAIAIGAAPGEYRSSPDIQDRLKLLAGYLQRGLEKQPLVNQIMGLWASASWPGLITPAQRQTIVDAMLSLQLADGGWSLSSLGTWTRSDGTPQDARSDGYATGLVAFVLQVAGVPRTPALTRGLDWLASHQDPASGLWYAASLNKQRDPASDTGRFMSDAATSYAVLALTKAGAR